MIARLITIVLAGTLSVSAAAPALASPSQSHAQMTRYTGAPDLQLTAAVVAAGGGAKHFSSLALLSR
jgi:hypothetical protein